VHALRSAGHSLTLLAPTASGSVLRGGGPSEVDALLPWEQPDVATLLGSDGVPAGSWRDLLRSFDAAIAYTRNQDLLRNLKALVPRVIARDPTPLPGAGHASAWLAEPALELGAAASPPPPHQPTRDETEQAAPLLATLPPAFLAIHPGSGSAWKNWPAPRFAALAAALARGPWLLVEGPADEQAAAPLRLVAGATPARDLPPRVLGALLSRAGVYAGNDSGVSHLAAAWGAPTVALFGPTDPDVWSPVGARVRVLRSPTEAMDGIAVDDVVAAMCGVAGLPSG
jgi:ADP-heptose:LPS heptosyltransferase